MLCNFVSSFGLNNAKDNVWLPMIKSLILNLTFIYYPFAVVDEDAVVVIVVNNLFERRHMI